MGMDADFSGFAISISHASYLVLVLALVAKQNGAVVLKSI